jgi:hypothetical protein
MGVEIDHVSDTVIVAKDPPEAAAPTEMCLAIPRWRWVGPRHGGDR